jgi:hypothetical protein
MGDGRFFLRRAYHFFELTSFSTRFSSIDSANIFSTRVFFFQLFQPTGIGQVHVTVFLAPPVKSLLRDVMF